LTTRAIAPASIALGLFTVLTWIRVDALSEDFWLLGEQIRDWSLALGSWSDLPLAGTPSTVGGRSLGPIYYWVLWLTRVTIGPWFDNLPHAGAVGLAIAQSLGDIALFFAIRRHAQSASLALAVVLLAAFAPYDVGLTRTVWNPPLAVAFVKLAMALFLVSATHQSRWRMAATIVAGWLAVQAHSSAIFVFVPLASWFVIRELVARDWTRAAQMARLLIEIVIVMQIPYLVDRMTSPAAGAPSVAIEAVARAVTDPAHATPGAAFSAISYAFWYLWAHPRAFGAINVLLIVAAAGCLWSSRREPWMLCVTVAPLLLAIVAFSGWTRPWENYWFLTINPPLALMAGMALRAVPWWKARESLAIAALLIVLLLLPARIIAATQIHKLPEYGPLLRGSREVIRRTPEVRDIFTDFELPPSTDRTFLFVCLGGRVSTAAGYHARIARDGSVTFREAR